MKLEKVYLYKVSLTGNIIWKREKNTLINNLTDFDNTIIYTEYKYINKTDYNDSLYQEL